MKPIDNRRRAQGLVEYGLIITFVAFVAVAAIVMYGPAIGSLLASLGWSV